jgi:IS1 family transposase
MNRKSKKDRAQILNCLVEGNSIRSTARLTGASKNTIVRLLAQVGEACAWYQDTHLKNLPCKKVQVDEIWSFVYAKAKNVPDEKIGEAGDVWTWTAICADTKLVPSWRVGSRDIETARDFMKDLAWRMAERIQLTSDGLPMYGDAVYEGFGNEIDYAMLVKIYGESSEGQKRYSPAHCVGAKKKKMVGNPDLCCISTSFVERQNLTMRMSMRRFTRLTNAFSKKVENHAHAIALHFMNYNFVRIHKTLKVAPAMAAGVSDKLWSLENVIEMSDRYWNIGQNENESN